MRRYKTYINGEWFEGTSGIVLRSVDPSNNKELGEIVQNSKEDVEYAIESASRSFYKTREWRDLDVQQRNDKLLKIADMIESEIDEIAKTESMDNGKPLREAQADVDDAVHCFRYYAGLIRTPSGQTYNVNSNFGNMHSYTVKEPVGVCALITPWNFPFLMSVWKIAPALAAGNSIIFKPSSETVLSALKLFEILDKCDLPKGTANLVIGSGSTVGNLLAESKKVDMITFTGSTSVGQGIMRAAAGNVKKIGLELGGKSPNIVFADTDIDKTVEWVMMGIFLNQGEVCCAGSRLIIEKSIKDKFLKKLVERTDKLTLGAPLDNPDMGPLISKKHMQDVQCTITGSDDNSIESMSIIYDDLGEWIREYYEDADCTIEKTSDEISEVDALNILRMFYASAILYTDVGLSSEDISDSCDILDTSLERYRYTGDYLTDESDSVSVKCGNYVYLLSITPNGSNALSLSVYSIDYYNENMDLAGLPHYSGPEI